MYRILALSMSLMLGLLGISCPQVEAQITETSGAIKTGDWIKYEVTITPILEGEDFPTWVKFEFIYLEGTNSTVKATMHLSSGREVVYNGTIDVVSGSNTGLIIPSNSTIGDSVYIDGYESIIIEGETTLTYTGVNRTVVRASYSNSTDYYAGVWDKQTGVKLEDQVSRYDRSTTTLITTTTILKISDTNIWQTRLNDQYRYQNVFYVAIVIGMIAIPVIFWRTRKKKPRRSIR